MECFIIGLKEATKTHVRMHQPSSWLEAYDKALDAKGAINAQCYNLSITSKSHPTLTSGPTQTCIANING